MAAAPGGVRLWFRLEGAASASSVVVPDEANVDDLRKEIKAALANKLKDVDAVDLRLSTADGKTYEDEEARVPTVHQTKKEALIVTGTFVRAARSPFAAAYGPRSSCGGGGHPSSSRRYALLPARSCRSVCAVWCSVARLVPWLAARLAG